MTEPAVRPDASDLDLVVAAGEPVQLPVAGVPDQASMRSWLAEHREPLRSAVLRHGHLLIRGLPVRSPADFAAARDVLVDEVAAYPREETTPRTGYGDDLFSATDLPPEQTIRLHNEDSYSVVFPGLLLFACLTVPDSGGETTLGDVRRLLRSLPAEVVDRFRSRGWLITRTFHPHIGMSWQRAFGTDDRDEVAAYCAGQQVGWEWLPDGRLRTTGLRSATLRHPTTGEEVWFNHIAVFNQWTHDDETREVLLATCGADGLPQNTCYGDGAEIDRDTVAALNRGYDEVTVPVRWHPGDLLLVDNLLSAHGRRPYTGRREVLVALGDPVRATDCSPSHPIGPGPAPGDKER